ncbi:LOW QUALITY PROTEIN: hypothetical protein Cgig2_013292 [Carnegiea gigantea]|uniref:Uncharacterized protein n=1 Tax=Carnegiea gigantea TaxID=171969 RepID=A0A9Q1GFT7_9CARY|nr:LOW QUALITY PROTEIN: hypothetical protein Cgig2_013292 [Carnegiea gigantea]
MKIFSPLELQWRKGRGPPRVTPSNSGERVPAAADDRSHSDCQYEKRFGGTPSKSGLGRDGVEPQSQADIRIQEIGAQAEVRTQPKSSYASLVDPEEGDGLKFVSPQIEEEEGQAGMETNCTRDPPVTKVSEARPEQQSISGGFIHPRSHRPLTVTTERLPEQNSFMALLEEEAPPDISYGPSWSLLRGVCKEPGRCLEISMQFYTSRRELEEMMSYILTLKILHNLYTKLQQLQYHLRKLNRDKFADIHEQQRNARGELERVQKEFWANPTNEELLTKEGEYRERYLKLLKSSLSLMKQ